MSFKVAVDVDSVLNNLIERTIEVYNNRYGSHLNINDFHDYDIFKNMEYDDAQNFINIWKEEELWRTLSPKKDAQWGIKRLVDNGYEVYFVTATHYSNFAWKVEWLKSLFGMVPEKNIICLHNKGLLNVDVLIDDCMDNLLSMNCDRVCFSQPWNIQYNRDSELFDKAHFINRASSWEEVVDIVNRIYEWNNSEE